MNMRKTLATAGLGAVVALSFAAAAAMPVFADDANTDTRLGNSIGYGQDGGTTTTRNTPRS